MLNESDIRGQIIAAHRKPDGTLSPFSPAEQVALGYKPDQPLQYGTSQAYAEAYNRVTNPAKYGQPSQTDQDLVQATIEGKKKGDGLSLLLGGLGGGAGAADANGDQQEGAANPTPGVKPPGTKPMPTRGTAGSTSASAISVKTHDDAARLPKGTWFVAPDGIRRQRK